VIASAITMQIFSAPLSLYVAPLHCAYPFTKQRKDTTTFEHTKFFAKKTHSGRIDFVLRLGCHTATVLIFRTKDNNSNRAFFSLRKTL